MFSSTLGNTPSWTLSAGYHVCKGLVLRRAASSQSKWPVKDASSTRVKAHSGEPQGDVEQEVLPWNFAFQCNERYLDWDDSAQRQLIKLCVAKKLNKEVVWVNERLAELTVLLPGLLLKVERLKPDLLAALVSDTQEVAAKLLALREALPGVDLAELLSRHPGLLLELDAHAVAAQLGSMRAHLPGVAVENLIQREPMLLRADMERVLGDIRRLLPSADPVSVLVRDPSIVIDMNTAGMPSAEGEDLLALGQ